MAGDSRKDYLLTTTANYFGVAVSDSSITSLADSRSLNNFLDDGNATVLAGKIEGKRINYYNKVLTTCIYCVKGLKNSIKNGQFQRK